jgi:hypothetical protein
VFVTGHLEHGFPIGVKLNWQVSNSKDFQAVLQVLLSCKNLPNKISKLLGNLRRCRVNILDIFIRLQVL